MDDFFIATSTAKSDTKVNSSGSELAIDCHSTTVDMQWSSDRISNLIVLSNDDSEVNFPFIADTNPGIALSNFIVKSGTYVVKFLIKTHGIWGDLFVHL